MRARRSLLPSVLTVAMILAAVPAMAETITWDWTTVPSPGQGSIGNSRTLTVNGVKVTATAWGHTVGTGEGTAFAAAALGAWSSGLGICNADELADGTCVTSGSTPEHPVDNWYADDWVLFVFTTPDGSAPVSVDPTSIRITPFGSTMDRDVTYWLRTTPGVFTASSLAGKTYTDLGTLGFGTQNNINNSTGGTMDVALPPTGAYGNALLIGAWRTTGTQPPDGDTLADYFKISELTAETVPEPATLVLVGLGVAGATLARRRLRPHAAA